MTYELRIGDKILVLDGKSPLRFYFGSDPQRLLHTFDDEGNALYTGESYDK